MNAKYNDEARKWVIKMTFPGSAFGVGNIYDHTIEATGRTREQARERAKRELEAFLILVRDPL
jgi:hypothetical protein